MIRRVNAWLEDRIPTWAVAYVVGLIFGAISTWHVMR